MSNARRSLDLISLNRPWFSKLSRGSLSADLFAGLTNAAIVLPQGVAFAIIAGMPPEYGLFTAITVTVIAAFWGSSNVMVSGPTTAISVILFATLSEFSAPGTAEYIALAITLTLMVGMLQLAAGFTGLGGLISFVSHSVIVGFTAAAALMIATSQLAGFLGLGKSSGGVRERVFSAIEQLDHVNSVAVSIALATLASLLVANFISRKLPSYIIALSVGALFSHLLSGPDHGVAMFDPLQSIVPALTTPDLSISTVGQLLPGAAAVALVGLLEAISIGKTFATRRAERYDTNQEIVGQGLSNIAGSFLQSYAGSGSFTRSGLNADSGARTPLAAIFAAGILFAALFFVRPAIPHIPVPAMAAIIMYVAWRLISFSEIRHIVTSSRSDTLILIVTFLTGVLSELDFAILIGTMISLSVFLNKSAHPKVSTGAPTEENGRRVFRHAYRKNLDQCPQITLTRIEGPLFFASVEHVEAEFRQIEEHDQAIKTRVLGLKGVGKIDLSGADFLMSEVRRARKNNRDLFLHGLHPQNLSALTRMHVTENLGESHIFPDKNSVLKAAVAQADDSICRNCAFRVFHECAGKPGPDDVTTADSATASATTKPSGEPKDV